MTNRSTPVRLGLVGVGKIARDQHLPAIAGDPRFELVATASPHGRVDGIPGYSSIEEMLAGGHELDAVSIATPPAGRSAIAAPAIDAGLDIMLEKPPAAGLSEVEAMKAKAATAGTILFASWHSREAAGVATARNWLADRNIRRVVVTWQEDIRRWHPGQDWILAPGGFGVFDPAVNAFSILTAILPEPICVEAAELAIPSNREAPTSASVRMRSGSAEVSVDLDFLHQGEPCWNIEVDTDGGSLLLRQGGTLLEVDGSAVAGPNTEYLRLYAHFAGLIAARKSDVDVAPLRLVADAFLVASRRSLPEFHW
jgi:D-galactose 1-dehydrogenase/L-arabinose 1- dehydrogenase